MPKSKRAQRGKFIFGSHISYDLTYKGMFKIYLDDQSEQVDMRELDLFHTYCGC